MCVLQKIAREVPHVQGLGHAKGCLWGELPPSAVLQFFNQLVGCLRNRPRKPQASGLLLYIAHGVPELRYPLEDAEIGAQEPT